MKSEKATDKKCPIKCFRGKSGFFTATVVLVLVFFILAACFIGGFSGTGKPYYANSGSNAVFYLDFQKKDEGGAVSPLKEVYVNIGTVYNGIGKDFDIEFEHMSTLGKYSDRWVRFGTTSKEVFGNMQAQDVAKAKGTNYNWVKVYDFTDRDDSFLSTHNLVRLTFGAEMFVNEVVFVDASGSVIPAVLTRAEAKTYFEESNWLSGYRELFADEKKDADILHLVDSQNGYTDGKTSYSNYTPDEMYTLMQLDNLRLGRRTVNGIFTADRDFGPFAVLFPYVGTLIFGNNPFGLRIFSVLFAAALIVTAYLFGKKMFGSEGFGFLFALLAAIGGLTLTVGRLGLAYPMLAFLVFASFYFMYKFFADGISKEFPVKSSCNILVSGLLFAFAFATDPKCVFALLGLVPLFIVGAVRQHKQVKAEAEGIRKEFADRNIDEESDERMMENLTERDRRARLLTAESRYISRIMWAFFIVTFIFATAFITVVSAIPSYYTYVKLYAGASSENANLFGMIWKAITDTFTVSNTTAFTSANAISAFAWLLPIKGATLFSASVAQETYIALNAQLNFGMAVTALIGFLFMTIYTIVYFATGRENSAYASAHTHGILNAYFVLTAGLITSLLQYAVLGGASATQSLLFSMFYIGFIVLTIYTAYVHDASKVRCVCGFQMNRTIKVTVALVALYAVLFLLSLPMVLCIPIAPTAASVCFGWTTFVNNGFYRM